MGFARTLATAPKNTFSFFMFVRKYWYWLVLILVILPGIIESIRVAVQTQNPSYPFFVLGTRLLTADAQLGKDVMTLQTNPDELVGMVHPTTGIWNHFKWYWLYFWHVIYHLIALVWLIFFPLVIIWKLMHLRNTSEMYKTTLISIGIFLMYLFIANTVILVHDMATGTGSVQLPAEADTFTGYWLVLVQLAPFHGLYSLGAYLVDLAIR